MAFHQVKSVVMKYLFLSPVVVWFLSLLVTTSQTSGSREHALASRSGVISCAPARSRSISSTAIGILPGTGKHHWVIGTKSDSAQAYFDQGMNLYYSFHIIEALASILKAETFDPSNGLLYWAEALCYGPNINDIGYSAAPDVFPAVKKAMENKDRVNSLGRDMIDAISVRYSNEVGADQPSLNLKYRDAMRQVYLKHPKDPEVLALYADALMQIHPWDLYEHDGAPKAWTPEIVSLLESGLAMSPSHPGINHYYIHAVEASREPGRALASASRLGSITPGVAHMVHMPSHIYIRTGNYSDGMKVNVSALEGYQQYLGLYPPVVNNAYLYQFHNTHLLASCAIMNGNHAMAAKYAAKCRDDIPAEYFASPSPFREFVHYLAATPVFAAIRYGRWEELLAMPDAPDTATYQKILTSFGKGMAHARKGHVDAAEKDLTSIHALMESDAGIRIKMGAFNSGYEGAAVAVHMLAGAIAEAKGDLPLAIMNMKRAVDAEGSMVYNEPKDWILPPLPYLGSVQLKAGDAKAAEASFRKDLAFNPHNCWSLKGLSMALDAQGKGKESASVRKELEKALEGSDIVLVAAVF
jgi:tetratricopeptide (TPR) repeat protein